MVGFRLVAAVAVLVGGSANELGGVSYGDRGGERERGERFCSVFRRRDESETGTKKKIDKTTTTTTAQFRHTYSSTLSTVMPHALAVVVGRLIRRNERSKSEGLGSRGGKIIRNWPSRWLASERASERCFSHSFTALRKVLETCSVGGTANRTGLFLSFRRRCNRARALSR